MTRVPREQHSREAVAAILRSQGCPSDVWLMEEHQISTQQRLDLAVAEVIDGWGLLICKPGVLAYLDTEESGGFILRREP